MNRKISIALEAMDRTDTNPQKTMAQFKRTIWRYYRRNGRSFPWRTTRNPYHILVSEIMLQQTQADRVVAKYMQFIRTFKTPRALANAPLAEILRIWQGLGYNRRARYLKAAAQEIESLWQGRVPKYARELERLPGIGPYSAGAIACFAYDTPSVFIETNIRTVITHFFFPHQPAVRDCELVPILEAALPRNNVREWYFALMDYGAMLKRTGHQLNAQHSGYTKQKPFKGSNREIRGRILKILLEGNATDGVLARRSESEPTRVRAQVESLLAEGFIQRKGRKLSLAD